MTLVTGRVIKLLFEVLSVGIESEATFHWVAIILVDRLSSANKLLSLFGGHLLKVVIELEPEVVIEVALLGFGNPHT